MATPRTLLSTLAFAVAAGLTAAPAYADNNRLNNSVIADVYAAQRQAGCTNDIRINPQLQLAAQRHTHDVVANRNLDGDNGSDGSTAQDRANAAGYRGNVAETVAINQSIAISGNDLLNRWYYNPAYKAIMSNCANSQMGVWSENSPDRTVVVAVYGQPPPSANARQRVVAELPPGSQANNIPLDPSPDYDASDELEFGNNWWAWILRGLYPPPGIPPQ